MTADATLVQLYNCCISVRCPFGTINHVGRCRKTHQTRGKVLLFYPPVLVNLWEVNLQFTVLSVHQLTRCFNVCCIFSDMLYKIPCLQQKVHGLTVTVILKHPPPTSGTNRECLPRWDCMIVYFSINQEMVASEKPAHLENLRPAQLTQTTFLHSESLK